MESFEQLELPFFQETLVTPLGIIETEPDVIDEPEIVDTAEIESEVILYDQLQLPLDEAVVVDEAPTDDVNEETDAEEEIDVAEQTDTDNQDQYEEVDQGRLPEIYQSRPVDDEDETGYEPYQSLLDDDDDGIPYDEVLEELVEDAEWEDYYDLSLLPDELWDIDYNDDLLSLLGELPELYYSEPFSG